MADKKGYWIAHVHVTDPDSYARYVEGAKAAFEKHGAEFLARGGASIQHISSDQQAATIEGDIVVLAVPHTALATIAQTYGDQLAGKTVVDITNPLNFETFDSLGFDRQPDGACVLYLDGHVEYVRFGEDFPVLQDVRNLLEER